MLDNGKISVRQFRVLTILFTVGSAILVIPSILVTDSKQDAWIGVLLAIGTGMFIIIIYNALAVLFPDLSLVEIIECLLGKWIGSVVSLTYVFFFFYNASALLLYIGDFMTTQMMPETPIQPIMILFLAIVIIGTRLGLEVIARSAEILCFWFLLLFVVLVIFISPQIDWKNVQPVFESGVKPIILTTIHFLSFTILPLITFLMFFPAHINQLKNARKAFITGSLIGGIILFIIVFLSILVLGPDQTARQLYPSYVLAKKINVGNFVQRIEVIIAIMWFISLYIKMTVYFYGSIIGFAQILKLKNYRFLTFPFGMIMVTATIVMHPNVVYIQTFDAKTWPVYGLTYGLLLPLLLLGLAVLRKKGSRKRKLQSNSRS
ncbi:GerAB/ArcD/ProY family transporter [Pseudalkalibacillus decolorationis]|uniref:GerAB/ArcD/ProY family transporter n=1 Tax=Pseudalkalibacillus decolorationis TaxID=163879 RepID=UPI00214762E4|nr:endospore germination permease [Pseudalkalibacillus decolorationis]